MINLRYHIVSLTAVFLALALGVIAGTTVINKEIVTALRAQRNNLVADRNALEVSSDSLKQQLALWESYGATLEPSLVRNQLKGRALVLVSKAGVTDEVLALIESTAIEAGAQPSGRREPAHLEPGRRQRPLISGMLRDRARDVDASLLRRLALGEARPEDRQLLADAATRIAARLRRASDPGAQTDLLNGLDRAGFIQTRDLAAGAFPARGTLFVVVSSGAAEGKPSDADFMVPLLRAIAGAAAGAVSVAEPLGAQDSLVEMILGDVGLRSSIPTVDHVDTVPGRIALVAGLHVAAAGGEAVHYGVKRQTSGIAPTPSP